MLTPPRSTIVMMSSSKPVAVLPRTAAEMRRIEHAGERGDETAHHEDRGSVPATRTPEKRATSLLLPMT